MASPNSTAEYDLGAWSLEENRWLTLRGYIGGWRHPDDDGAGEYISGFAGSAEAKRDQGRMYTEDFYVNHRAEINGRFTPARLSARNSEVYMTARIQPDRYIRLWHLQPHTKGREIRCDLLAYPFPPSVPYEALSYCWGSNSKSETISVNNRKNFQITDNLAAALRRLRLPRESRILWVDAICIDQADIAEKNVQVRLMGDIYGTARRTLLWLGDGIEQQSGLTNEGTDNRSFRFLTFIGTCLLWLINFLLGRSAIQTPVHPTADDLQDLRHALISTLPSWWERLWTVQEVLRSRDLPDICFGSWQLRWHDFIPLVKRLTDSGGAEVGKLLEYDQNGRTTRIDPNKPWFKALKLEKRLSELEDLRSTFSRRRIASLVQLAHLNERATVTDPRDRVYSLLGLVQVTEARMNKIDYSSSNTAQMVYARATYSIMERNSNLHMLEYVSASTSHDPAMPTWALDFATPTISWVNIAGSRLDPEYQQNGTSDELVKTQLSADSKLITVSGYFMDRVDTVYPLGLGQNSPLFNAAGSNWTQGIGRRPDGSQYWIGSSLGKVDFFWEMSRLRLRPMSASAFFGGNRQRLDSTADRVQDGVLDHIFNNWLRFSAGLVMPMGDSHDTPEGAYWWNHLRRGRVRGHDNVGVHPTFYVTGKGYIGVGPPDTQQGDNIVALIGTPSFSLVRSRGRDRFAFKGFTYLSVKEQQALHTPELWPIRRDTMLRKEIFKLM